jgi:hypothetical protein
LTKIIYLYIFKISNVVFDRGTHREMISKHIHHL